MNRALRFITQIYGGLIKLFPLEFQEEFGEELQVVFSTMLVTAARKSKLEIALTCLQELRDFPILLVRSHLEKNNILKLFHSQPTRFAFRGAVGYSLGFAFVYFFSSWSTSWLSPLLNPMNHGWTSGLPTMAGFGLAAIVAGLLFALLFNEVHQFGWYATVGILGWFISQSSVQALWLSLQPNLYLEPNQLTILGIAELALVGALLSTMICVARSNRRQLVWPLVAGTILYPIAAYLFPQLLLRFRIQFLGIEHLWFFIALTFLVVIQLAGAIWLAIKSDRRIPWLVIASIPIYPLIVYTCDYLVFRFHLYFSQSWHTGYTVMDFLVDFENIAVPGIIFGIVLGMIFGWQRRSIKTETGSLKIDRSTLNGY